MLETATISICSENDEDSIHWFHENIIVFSFLYKIKVVYLQ